MGEWCVAGDVAMMASTYEIVRESKEEYVMTLIPLMASLLSISIPLMTSLLSIPSHE